MTSSPFLESRFPVGSSARMVESLIGFSAAYGQLTAATLTAVAVLPEALATITAYQQAKPILEHALEEGPRRRAERRLQGRLALSHVSFRYGADGPAALDDVSIEAAEGEFIALVGASGCGKSTILRLLLGFERPAEGVVSYDGVDLAALDSDSVRRQMGVVLQDSRPLAGDIYSCISGGVEMEQAAVLQAARLADIEKDIEAMPMGLHTPIAEGAPAFSGGQRQRLMIARALVRSPKILLLDEATSALDNATQAAIRRNIDGLNVTRVVAAHRLSTIARADRIYVLEAGRVAQVGTYPELMVRPGAFQRLARLQARIPSDPLVHGDRRDCQS